MELVDGLELAKEMGFNRYQIMYAIYQGNKESFINNDINLPKQNENFFVDLSLVENLETNNEVGIFSVVVKLICNKSPISLEGNIKALYWFIDI